MAVDTIKSFPSDAIKCYTDGSAMKGPDRAGFGAFIEYPDRIGPDRISGACGLVTCTIDARATGIAREKLTVGKTVVVVTDAMAVLQAISGLEIQPRFIEEVIGAAGYMEM